MLSKIATTLIRPGLVSLMLALPLAGAIAVTTATPVEAGHFKFKKFKKAKKADHYKYKRHHGHFKHHRYGSRYSYGHKPSVVFKFKKFKKFH